MFITAAALREKGACEEQVIIFEREWPDGAETSVENFLHADSLGLDFVWVAMAFLSSASRKKFNQASSKSWNKYKSVIDGAQEEFNRTTTDSFLAEQARVQSMIDKNYDLLRDEVCSGVELLEAKARSRYIEARTVARMDLTDEIAIAITESFLVDDISLNDWNYPKGKT